MIRFSHVSKRYETGNYGLSDIDLELTEGEMVFVTGHSGAGKSTLLRLIGLIERPTRGQLIVDGRNLATLPNRRVPYHRRHVGMIFQDHRLLADRTVYDNVSLPLVVAGVPHRDLGRRVRAALDKVGLLRKERAYPLTLSGGEQQRVGIARAIVSRPPVLLADEPSGNLDKRTSERLHDLLFELRERRNLSLVVVTHNADLAGRADRVLQLDGGRLHPNARV